MERTDNLPEGSTDWHRRVMKAKMEEAASEWLAAALELERIVIARWEEEDLAERTATSGDQHESSASETDVTEEVKNAA